LVESSKPIYSQRMQPMRAKRSRYLAEWRLMASLARRWDVPSLPDGNLKRTEAANQLAPAR
jgi:hypothetical protein